MGLRGVHQHAKPRRKPRQRIMFEAFEPRLFLSAGPTGFTPAQIRKAYGLDQVLFGNITGDGTGQTIAIIDAYDSPNIATDLHSFDVTFGIADPPSFIKISQTGSTSVFPPSPPAGTPWAVEAALDVEWAHALAPGANILLVEANSSTNTDLWGTAVNTARAYAGVSVVSMSFSTPEPGSSELTFDANFLTPATHNGVTFIASTGDLGAPGGYPAYSPNVISVGGTTLTTQADGTYVSETAWSGSGGGISTQEPQPDYQSASGIVTQSFDSRTTPDVSFDADPSPGIPYYLNGAWGNTFGTSFGAPAWAAIIAVANQGRSLAGLGTLDGATDTLPRLYAMPASYFHDITQGSNGNAATAGYDLVTGRGSPRANLVIASLATPPVVSFNMSTNPNWILDGTSSQAWQYGVPQGLGTPKPDPTSGHTGADVIGFNLAGNYAQKLGQLFATTPVMDFTNYTNLKVGFWRWLGIGGSSNASIQAWDGTNWTTIWANTDEASPIISDTAWVYQEFALPPSTYNNATVKLRWVMGATSNLSSTSSGWNIDDVSILATPLASVNGQIFTDANSNGTLDAGEQPMNGVSVYLDLNNSGGLDPGEPTQTTSGAGNYSFKGLTPGTYTLREVLPAHDLQTTAPSAAAVDDGIASTRNLGLFPTLFNAGTYAVTYNAGQTVISGGATTLSIATGMLSSLTFDAGTGTINLSVDFAGGDPIPASGVSIINGANNSLSVHGGSRAFNVSSSQVTGGGDLIQFANVAGLTLGSGNFTIVAALSLTSLSLDPNAAVTLPSGGATPLTVGNLSIQPSSVLDLADNALIVNAGDPAAMLLTLTTYLALGRDGGDWNGLGLRSSAAHAAFQSHGNTEYTGLALALNAALPVPVTMLNGASVAGGAVIVKYTYAGDADLSGTLTMEDYLAADVGFLRQTNTYAAGDFDYSTTINAADFAIIDQNFNRQTGILAAEPSLITVAPALIPDTNADLIQPVVIQAAVQKTSDSHVAASLPLTAPVANGEPKSAHVPIILPARHDEINLQNDLLIFDGDPSTPSRHARRITISSPPGIHAFRWPAASKRSEFTP